MKILVCLKQILDPEIPPRDFKIRSGGTEAELEGANLVANIFCENALETALQFREELGEGEITVLCMGAPSADDTLRKALAMKADYAVRLDACPEVPADSLAGAKVLAALIGKLGGFDLILLGREAGDWGMGQTGPYLAEILGLPIVSFVDEIKKEEDHMVLRRQTDDGWERYRCPIPLVATITNSDDNLPRIPKTRDIMKSSRKPIDIHTLESLGLSANFFDADQATLHVKELFIPEGTVECDFVTGDTLDEKVEQLAERMAGVVKGL
jgi:electron transfer flavoprotein beta subunit